MSDDEFFKQELQKKSKKKKFQPNIQDSEDEPYQSRRSKEIFEETKRERYASVERIINQKEEKNEKYGSDSDSDESKSSDALSEITNESLYFIKKTSYQKRALFRKNLTLQLRQKCTNICQVVTPVLALSIILLLKYTIVDMMNIYGDKAVYIPFPFIFNLDYRTLSNLAPAIEISTCNQWYLYEFDEKVSEEEKKFFGQNKGMPLERPRSEGLLKNKNVFTYPCDQVKKNSPYFQDFEEMKDESYSTMNSYLFKKIDDLQNVKIVFKNKDIEDPALDALPDGAYTIKEASKKRLRYNVQTNDCRFWHYHRDNGVTKIGFWDEDTNQTHYVFRTVDGQVHIVDLINQAYMRELFPDTTVVSGINYFPFKTNFDREINRVLLIASAVLLPICMCTGLPVFLYSIVLEKETKLTEFMKINGMRMKSYWLINFTFNLMLYCLQALIFFLCGSQIFRLDIFTQTNYVLQLVCLFGWGLCQVSMALFLSVFMSKAETATIVGYAISIWCTSIAVIKNITVYALPNHMEYYLYALPPFTFSRLYFYFSWQCAYEICIPNFQSLPFEFIACLISLYASSVFYLLLALYLQQVVPQKYGVAKPWNFLCKRKKNKNNIHRHMDDIYDIYEDRERGEIPIFDFDTELEDADAKNERNIVQNLAKENFYKYPLIIKDLRKVYPGFGGRPEKPAVKNFSLKVKRGEMFGLLGPNGAGKTSLISMLMGMFKPSQGNAWIAGYDIRDQLDMVQLQIGVCPQFDILWNDLTVEEHLYFYARLKGISPENEDQQVSTAIQEVLLERFRHFKVKQLSGGMKRRLSIAISLVSEPKIIFLDEPSTGLDPENRRQLWDILTAQKGKRAIVITTHSMEEADVLCSKIAIVDQGILRCIGAQQRLKSIYGGGYHLFINCQKGKALKIEKQQQRKEIKSKTQKKGKKKSEIIQHPSLETKSQEDMGRTLSTSDITNEEDFEIEEIEKRIVNFVALTIPNAILIREFNGNFVYQIETDNFDAENLFIQMEKNKDRLKITDWGISQCSLEDVFNRIIEKN